MSYRTYEEWEVRGRVVKQGEKAAGRLNDGTALFSKEQTIKRLRHPRQQPDCWYLGDGLDYM